MSRSRVEFTLDSAGIQEILKSGPVRQMVTEATEAVASNTRGLVPDDVEVGTAYYDSTDRYSGLVAIKHPSGKARQLKHGSLTKAAGQLGLTVRSK